METARCRAFLAAAETGSFSRAAEMLRYTPSGVNQLVTALEKEIGFSLFSRSTKGVALTANGQLLLPVIREILHQEDKLFELSAQMNGLLIGTVTIAAVKATDADKAKKMIEAIVKEPEPGEIYYGKVVRLMNFGAFVNLLPGKDGMVHISKMADHRIEKVEDAVKEGDMVWVKVMEIDDKGRVNLSMKDVKPEEKVK